MSSTLVAEALNEKAPSVRTQRAEGAVSLAGAEGAEPLPRALFEVPLAVTLFSVCSCSFPIVFSYLLNMIVFLKNDSISIECLPILPLPPLVQSKMRRIRYTY